MKKIVSLFIAFAIMQMAKADEGMWLPYLIGKNYDDMVRKGLVLSAEDLYAANHSSLKDAIVQFNGGCTGEIISNSGLLLTNHHCGYDAIATLSTVEKNYLDNGFWALSKDQELPAVGVSVLFLESMEDVTAQVNKVITGLSGEALTKALAGLKKEMETKANEGGKFYTTLKEYFNGNQYILIKYKKYTDVRLVGTPPKSLGKFGGDTDNWMWPRHTADFSMFRVYANENNEPADYNKNNKPYHPKNYLAVSAKGVREGDYAMIFGYPGRTNRYETAAGVDLAIQEVNPTIVAIRDARLAVMRKHMQANKAVYLKLTSTYARIANYWKYFIGQTEQLKRLQVVNQKSNQEQQFIAWSNAHNYDYAKEFETINAATKAYKPYAKFSTYYSEAFRGCLVNKIAYDCYEVYKKIKNPESTKDSLSKLVDQLKKNRASFIKSTDMAMEQDWYATSAAMIQKNLVKEQFVAAMSKIALLKDNNYNAFAEAVYKKSFLVDSAAFEKFCAHPTLKQMNEDLATQYAFAMIQSYDSLIKSHVDAYNEVKTPFAKKYLKGLLEMKNNQLMYPDANSTMRITYGTVKSYEPTDGVKYKYYTTLDGLAAKYKAGDDEFDAPQALIDLYKKKDYGNWADADGTLHTCFITNNDITGGNSGSPVLNAKGELIGAAFDGNWEAMSGDIAFDKKYKRTIVCDVRYILFLIDKLGNAQNLIQEMDIQ